MNVLWLSWKDCSHPQAGGAEVVSNELRKRLVADGHKVRLLTADVKNLSSKTTKDGVEIFRTGNKYTVYANAKKLYKKSMKDWPDLIVDEMNTIPFLSFKYSKDAPSVLLTYQLAREVWFYQMMFPLSWLGYLIEPIYLRYMSHNKYKLVLTESESTRKDLVKYGFSIDRIKTFRVGMYMKPVEKLTSKKNIDTVLYLGSVRPMKQTLHAVIAFELARDKLPNIMMSIIGDYSGRYGDKVAEYISLSRHKEAIALHGRVSAQRKEELVKQADIIVITSVKEGWGLIATEAASQGLPAVGYATDGLRDSILDGKTGLLAKPNDQTDLANKMERLLTDKKLYTSLRLAGLEYSRQFTFENSYADFTESLGILAGTRKSIRKATSGKKKN
jgi:glycosyltransferase involved in cell wall biosynthesis